MELILIDKNGKEHVFTLPTPEPVTSDWLRELCAEVFKYAAIEEVKVDGQ